MNPSEPQPRRPSWVPQLFVITAALSASTGAGIVAMQTLPAVEVFGQRFEPPRLNLFPSEQSFPPRQGWPVYNGSPTEAEEPGGTDAGAEPTGDGGAPAPGAGRGLRDRAVPLRTAEPDPIAPRPQFLDPAPLVNPADGPSGEGAIAPEADDRPPRRNGSPEADRSNFEAPAQPLSPRTTDDGAIGSGGNGGRGSNGQGSNGGREEIPRDRAPAPEPPPRAAPAEPSREAPSAPAPLAPAPPPVPSAPPPPPPSTADTPGG